MLLLLPSALAIGCRNNAKNVDWWLVFKLPSQFNSTFLYYDSQLNAAGGQLQYYSAAVDSKGSPLESTLSQANSEPVQSLAWNDQNQVLNSSTSAHSKGYIAYSKSARKGIYLLHSVPGYPTFSGNTLNTTIAGQHLIYGQHLLCLSLDVVRMNLIAGALKYMQVNPYHNTLVGAADNQNLIQMAAAKATSGRLFNSYAFYLGGYQFFAIGKSNGVNGSLWEDGLNVHLQSSLLSETWGRPLEASWCPRDGRFQVTNIRELTFKGKSWIEYNDHAKWGVTLSHGSAACFGDMNRMPSQWRRGGSFICVFSAPLHRSLMAMISKKDVC